MRERGALLGGSLDTSVRDGRFRLHARLPLRRETHDPVRVLIVEDDALMRAGLRGVLGGDPAIEVVGEAGDGRDAVRPHPAARAPTSC